MRKLLPVSIAVVFITMTCLVMMWGCDSSSVGDQKAGYIEMSANRYCLLADGRSSSAINAVVIDQAGYPAPVGTDVVFRTNIGTFANGDKVFHTKVIDFKSGNTIVSLIAPNHTGTAEVEARANGIRQVLYIEIANDCTPEEEVPEEDPEQLPQSVAEPPSGAIQLTSSASTVSTDSAAEITATIIDANGQPAAVGTAVSFSTSEGTFANGEKSYSTTTADESGTAKAILYPDEGNMIATVLCTSGELSETIAVGFENP